MAIDRRELLRGAAAAAVVTAFLPAERVWATGPPPPGARRLPPLDGELLLDGPELDAAADDFGHIVSRQPYAVLRPGSVADIQRIVRFARRHRLKVAPMGRVGDCHSTYGQAQAAAGVVIDMAPLDRIRELRATADGGEAVVEGGVSWRELVEAAAPLGLAPPVLTDYLGLRVGGTLAVGGIGGQAYRAGFQVDQVLELEVVTGRGDRVVCSPRRHRFLFDSVRGGLGQLGVVIAARVRLERVPPMTRTYTALYPSAAALAADQERALADGRFDYLEGQAVPDGGGGWSWLLEAVAYFDPAAPPDDAALTGDLAFLPGTLATEDRTFVEFADRLAPLVDFLRSIGVWFLPHPWLNLFLPGPAAPAFAEAVVADEDDSTTGQGPILFYPFLRRAVEAPIVALPVSEVIYLFAVLRTAVPGVDPADLVARNRAIHDEAIAQGGKRYPVGSVGVDAVDWRRHFDVRWPRLALAKLRFDPGRVLTPGQGVF